MSRHRMVRNLTEDDYYDDDYNDYYDDDEEDDYDTSYVAAPKKAQTATATANTTANTNTTKKSTNHSNSKSAIASKTTTTISAKLVMPKATSAASSTAASATAAGVVKPPPGWGKPSPASSSTSTTAVSSASASASANANAGVNKPPPGWGKPTSIAATATATATASKNPTTTSSSSSSKRTESSSKPSSHIKSQQHTQYKPKPLPPCLQPNAATSSTSSSQQLSMVCIGHVDAGKSTIMGQLLVQTGQVTKRQAARQSVAGGTTNTGNTGNNASNASANQQPNLAWLLDETVSERERGVTMEIGTKCLTTQGKNQHQIVMLDAPGHADFIPIMITGAAHADAALLVVDAVTGEFEAGFQGGGQTKEHLSLAKGLGVTQIIVAINKLDVEGYQQERYEAVKEQLLHYLVHTQKFKPARIQCVPVSGLTGENIFQQTEPLLREWYQGGPTLLQAMDRFKLPIAGNRQLDKPLRFLISDMYAEGKGVVTRGRVVQGFLQVGDKVTVLPLGDAALISKVEHLQPPTVSSENATTNTQQDVGRLSVAVAGDTVEIVLANVDPMRVAVGNVVVDPTPHKYLPPIASTARAKILVMDNLTVPIIRGAQVVFHMHSLDVPASVTKLIALLNNTSSDTTANTNPILKERPRALTSGSSAIVELKLSDNTKIVMDRFQECRALGRFVLRRGGDTIAIGIIEEVLV